MALYRYNPSSTISQIFPKLWNDNASESSKVVGIRACATVAMEGQRLPWHPSVRALRSELSPAVRTMLRTQSTNILSGGARGRGRTSLDLPNSQIDVTWEILNLLALDPAFAFEGLGEAGDDTLSQLFIFVSSLTAAACPMPIRAQASTTSLVILDNLVETAKTDASRAALAVNSSLAIWQILIDSSRQLLTDFQMGDVDDMAMMSGAFRSTIHAVLSATLALPDLTKSPNARPAVLVAKVATITSLTGADVEQTNAAAPALRALSTLMILVRSAISNGQSQMDEITAHSTMLSELGNLPAATGRHQQQRAIRRIAKEHVRNSTLFSTVWIGLAARLRTLTARILVTDNNDRDLRRRNMAADIDGLSEDESKEWQNLISFLCATSTVTTSEMAGVSEVVGTGMLPRAYDEMKYSHGVVENFLGECVDFLVNNSVHVRESAKDALGAELPLSLCRVLVVQMTR